MKMLRIRLYVTPFRMPCIVVTKYLSINVATFPVMSKSPRNIRRPPEVNIGIVNEDYSQLPFNYFD